MKAIKNCLTRPQKPLKTLVDSINDNSVILNRNAVIDEENSRYQAIYLNAFTIFSIIFLILIVILSKKLLPAGAGEIDVKRNSASIEKVNTSK